MFVHCPKSTFTNILNYFKIRFLFVNNADKETHLTVIHQKALK